MARVKKIIADKPSDWQIVYCCLAIILVAFFVMLCSYATLEQGKLIAISRSFQGALEILPSGILIQKGDQISVLIETNGPGGLWTELGRCFSIGEPSQKLKDASDAALEAQKISLDMLKPGAEPKDLWDANNAFLERNGYFSENRLYAHGQGYDFVERPLIRYDEPMKIQAGMNITVHPSATNNSVWACFTDNYIITESGAGPCIHETPKKIIVV